MDNNIGDSNELITVKQDIEQRILEEEDPEELKELIDLFNLSLKKKDIIRSAKLSEVQDKIVDQISQRVEMRPDEFSNADLLNYHKTVQDTLAKTDNSLDNVSVPKIQINQQFNIDESGTKFDRESRKRILAAVDGILEDLTSFPQENTGEEDIND